MSRLLAVTLLLLSCVLLSACAAVSSGVDVQRDGSAEAVFSVVAEPRLMTVASVSVDALDDVRSSLESQGFRIAQAKEGSLQGFRGVKPLDATGAQTVGFTGQSIGVSHKRSWGIYDTYAVSVDWKVEGLPALDKYTTNQQVAKAIDQLDVIYRFNFPVRVRSHAHIGGVTAKDGVLSNGGRTVTWKIKPGFRHTFEAQAGGLVLWRVLLPVMILVAGVVGAVLVVYLKRRGPDGGASDEEPMEWTV